MLMHGLNATIQAIFKRCAREVNERFLPCPS